MCLTTAVVNVVAAVLAIGINAPILWHVVHCNQTPKDCFLALLLARIGTLPGRPRGVRDLLLRFVAWTSLGAVVLYVVVFAPTAMWVVGRFG